MCMAAVLSVSVCGCTTSGTKVTQDADTQTAAETGTDELVKGENADSENGVSPEPGTEDTAGEDQEDTVDEEQSAEEFLDVLEVIYSAAPGTAGSSIRLELAAKELLDFSETYGGKISGDDITADTNAWFDEMTESGAADIRADFAECLSMVKPVAETIAEDPSVPTPLAEDYDYTLQYDSYDTEKLEEICHNISLATENAQQ
ncbi:MAG: hypothetical protein K5929_00660, partial [Lachnospiraceae bacterium]|nr:hypothetical protein [Lachnospiraceae bacterium]